MPGTRTLPAGRYALELDGKIAGALLSAAGGYATADVVSQKAADGTVRKRLGNVRYADIDIACGSGTATQLIGWLTETLDGKYRRRNGALLTLDLNNTIVERLEFTNALLTEVGFPALDAASKNTVQLTARLALEHTRRLDGQGKLGSADKAQKWGAANFRVAIDGLECKRVMKIEPLVVGLNVVRADVREERIVEKQPIGVETPDLVVTLPLSDAKTFVAWHEDFVINGNCSEANEKTGTLELLSPTMTVLFTIAFKGLGIYELVPAAVTAADTVAKIAVSMYCQEIAISAK